MKENITCKISPAGAGAFMRSTMVGSELIRRLGGSGLAAAANGFSILLGILFILSGTGKLYMIREFGGTICSILPMPEPLCRIAAICIVGAELIGSAFLLRRRNLRYVAGCMLFLTAGFIVVLATAILRNHQIVCNCFGILNIRLENQKELLLDFILADLFIFIILVDTGIIDRMTGGVHRYSLVLLAVLLLTGEYWLYRIVDTSVRVVSTESFVLPGIVTADSGTIPRRPEAFVPVRLKKSNMSVKKNDGKNTRKETTNEQGNVEETPVLRFVADALPSFRRGSPGNRILLLVNFRDFDCHLCLDDFKRLAGDTQTLGKRNTPPHVVALFRKCPEVDPDHRGEFDKWLAANGVACPSFILPDSVYESIGFEKTTIVILDSRHEILFSKQLPLGEYGRREALDIFKKEQ